MTNYLEQWDAMFEDAQSQQANLETINRYYELETEAYAQILQERNTKLQGNVKELAEKLGFGNELVIFAGFLDGIKNSVEPKLELSEINDNTEINCEINFKQLYLEMRRAKAQWLYELPEWQEVLRQEERDELFREWVKENTRIHEKVGRNDDCPCGSGKKYKKCCGKN